MKKCPDCNEEFSKNYKIPKILNCCEIRICILCIHRQLIIKDCYICLSCKAFSVRNMNDLKKLSTDGFNINDNSISHNSQIFYSKAKTKYNRSRNKKNKLSSSQKFISVSKNIKTCKMNNCSKILLNNKLFCSDDCEDRFRNLSIIKGDYRKNISNFNPHSSINSSNINRDLAINVCCWNDCNNLREIFNSYELPFCEFCKFRWKNWPENLN